MHMMTILPFSSIDINICLINAIKCNVIPFLTENDKLFPIPKYASHQNVLPARYHLYPIQISMFHGYS